MGFARTTVPVSVKKDGWIRVAIVAGEMETYDGGTPEVFLEWKINGSGLNHTSGENCVQVIKRGNVWTGYHKERVQRSTQVWCRRSAQAQQGQTQVVSMVIHP